MPDPVPVATTMNCPVPAARRENAVRWVAVRHEPERDAPKRIATLGRLQERQRAGEVRALGEVLRLGQV